MTVPARVLALLLLGAGANADTHHDRAPDDVFRLKPLAGGVHALYGRGGNVGFFVGPEAVVVVDSQFKDLAPGIVDQIKSTTDKPIKYLLNTHHHGDHVGGNEVFRQFAVIVAHDNVRKRMLASPADILRDYPAMVEEARKAGNDQRVRSLQEQIEWARKVKVEEIAAPVLTFDSEFRIHMGGETIQVWHTPPAHTDGDSVIYFEKANVLHMGDLFFNHVIPFIDVKGGGSAAGYLVAIDKVVARVPPDVTVIPGHGEVTDLAGLKTFRQYVTDLIDTARRARAAGKTREDFLRDVDLPTYKDYAGYADRFKANAAAAWDGLSAR
ncbi:MAG TPA: MBL fold metallo-hydrolase, partial [Vicinamibacteria bacterium]|jgi:glyoxylase-like metal-dependent hydrolase (beta-lactamase superfamily II)